MRDLNIDCMDLYKNIDRFIKDAYSTTEGVSEYIRLMERNDIKGRSYVSTWSSDYKNLKHLRWIRNQLAHEVDYDSDICEESDYDWLESFKNRLYSSSDPLAMMKQAEEAERQKRFEAQRLEKQKLEKQRLEEQRRRQAQTREKQKLVSSYAFVPQSNNLPPKKKTLWQRIKSFFANI